MPKKPKKGSNPVAPIPAEAPARIRPEHIQDRTISAVAGSPVAWRTRCWPIEAAYENHRLATPSHALSKEKFVNAGNENTRWLAIREYDELYCQVFERSGRDSTDMDRVDGGGDGSWSETRADALKKLISVDSCMSLKDRTICRQLCEGHTLPYAVRQACGDDFVHAVAARVRDALDALDNALTRARAGGFRDFALDFEKSWA